MSSAAEAPAAVVERVPVFFEDLDAMGVVHNSRYVLFIERALASYWARAGYPFDPSSPDFGEIFFVVREFSITYRMPVTAAGTVGVELWIDRLGNSSVEYGFRVLSEDGGTVHAEGRRAQVRVDPATMSSARINDELRRACRPLLRGTAVGA